MNVKHQKMLGAQKEFIWKECFFPRLFYWEAVKRWKYKWSEPKGALCNVERDMYYLKRFEIMFSNKYSKYSKS